MSILPYHEADASAVHPVVVAIAERTLTFGVQDLELPFRPRIRWFGPADDEHPVNLYLPAVALDDGLMVGGFWLNGKKDIWIVPTAPDKVGWSVLHELRHLKYGLDNGYTIGYDSTPEQDAESERLANAYAESRKVVVDVRAI